MCDRIISPLKGVIRRYCNEGHDVLTAADMFAALKERPVKGCTAAVCEVDPAVKEIKVNKIPNFSTFHNFSYEKDGLRMWKAFEIGSGQLLSWSTLHVQVLAGSISSKPVSKDLCFWEVQPRVVQLQKKEADPEEALFECNEVGCSQSFDSYDAFQDHVNFGYHTPVSISQESTYDKLRREWVLKFSSMTVNQEAPHQPSALSAVTIASEPLKTGWALQKPRNSGIRFSERVKQYLQSSFDLGVQTGRKADPAQVSADMRNVKTAEGQRAFSQEEWLTKVQIKWFFSRLAAAQRKRTTGESSAKENPADEQELLQEELARLEEKDREEEIHEVLTQIALEHPIQYQDRDICSLSKAGALVQFTVKELRAICDYFELPRKSGERKSTLIDHVSNMVKECGC